MAVGWVWVAVMVVVFPIMIAVGFRMLEFGDGGLSKERWTMVLSLIYASNILLAGLAMRALRQMRLGNEELIKRSREMEEKRAKDEALLGSIGEGIVVTDRNGKGELINQQHRKINRI